MVEGRTMSTEVARLKDGWKATEARVMWRRGLKSALEQVNSPVRRKPAQATQNQARVWWSPRGTRARRERRMGRVMGSRSFLPDSPCQRLMPRMSACS